MEPWPAESTNRSRSNQPGLTGLWRRKRVQRRYAIGAAPIGIPGWPLLAFCTASTARKRMVLMQSSSNTDGEADNGLWVMVRLLFYGTWVSAGRESGPAGEVLYKNTVFIGQGNGGRTSTAPLERL